MLLEIDKVIRDFTFSLYIINRYEFNFIILENNKIL